MSAAVALTVGEPAGIGPELAAAAWPRLRGKQPYYLIADRSHVAGAEIPVLEINKPGDAVGAMQHGLPLFHLPFPAPVTPGQPNPKNASAILESITIAVEHAKTGQAIAVCTNPVNKKSLRESGRFPYAGQTEMLAELCGVQRAVMMLASPALRVVPATTHIAIADVPGSLDGNLLRETFEITLTALAQDFRIPRPRLAVAGLNPHAGEQGLFGDEELQTIRPVIESMRARGISISGPHPADTMFHQQARARYDAAVCMYHDQALIPLKTLSFNDGVNVTLGLPIVRTSPDHGTAFDIAGTGVARTDSLEAAICLAGQLARARTRS